MPSQGLLFVQLYLSIYLLVYCLFFLSLYPAPQIWKFFKDIGFVCPIR